MIPAANRPYVQGSIMTLCIVISITVSGVVRVLIPGAVSTSSALQELPELVLLYLNLAWIGSGSVTALGIVSGRKNLEAAGLVLMTGAFLSYFVAILAFKSTSAASVLYIFGFAIGAAWRAYFVVTGKWTLVAVRSG